VNATRDRIREIRKGLCSFCKQPVTIEDGYLEFYSDVEGRWGHPVPGCPPVAVLTHASCAPTEGYGYLLDSLTVEELKRPLGLDEQIVQKRWAHDVYRDALWMAAYVRRRLATRRASRPVPSDVVAKRVQPSASLRAYVFERDGFRCRRCGARPPAVQLVVDHIVPVCRGGRTVHRNLQTLCRACNAGKASRPAHAHDLEVSFNNLADGEYEEYPR